MERILIHFMSTLLVPLYVLTASLVEAEEETKPLPTATEEEMIKKRISINPGFKNSIIQQIPGGNVTVKSNAEESTNYYLSKL